jgi:hypothetical protein
MPEASQSCAQVFRQDGPVSFFWAKRIRQQQPPDDI